MIHVTTFHLCFQVHKFSKHALSNCTYWQDAKNLDQINLEDILADADKEGIHVILDDDEEQCFIELEDDEFEKHEEKYIQQYQQVEDHGEAFEVVEHTEDSQHSQDHPVQNDHTGYISHYPNQEHQYGYEKPRHYEPEIAIKQENYDGKKAIFNLNLGEFTVDEDPASHPEEFQNSGGNR